MTAPFLATITLLGGGAQPKGGGSTHLAMITPLGGGHIDQGLPEGPGWGGPADPGFGVGGIPHPGHGLPGGGFDPARPDHELPGTPVPPTIWPPQPLPPLPPDLETEVVVAVHRPGQDWVVKSRPAAMPKG